MVRKNQDNDFHNFNLTNINSITLNTQAVNDNQVNTKSYVHQNHQKNERSRRDLGINVYIESVGLVKNNNDNNFNNNKLTTSDIITIIRDTGTDYEKANKKYVVDPIGEGNVLRFNQTLEKYLKVSVGNDV